MHRGVMSWSAMIARAPHCHRARHHPCQTRPKARMARPLHSHHLLRLSTRHPPLKSSARRLQPPGAGKLDVRRLPLQTPPMTIGSNLPTCKNIVSGRRSRSSSTSNHSRHPQLQAPGLESVLQGAGCPNGRSTSCWVVGFASLSGTACEYFDLFLPFIWLNILQ